MNQKAFKNIILILFSFSLMMSCGGSETRYSLTKDGTKIEKKKDFSDKDLYEVGENEKDVLPWVEHKPVFVGGRTAMYKFIKRNLIIPEEAKKVKISGIVYVRFIVEKDGTITNPKVAKGLGYGCEEEARKVVMKMPPWTPAKVNGKPVRVYHNLPIAFYYK